jgi:hypothetical protein
MSLNNLSASLADLGRREDALAASEVALTIRRDLATQVVRCLRPRPRTVTASRCLA